MNLNSYASLYRKRLSQASDRFLTDGSLGDMIGHVSRTPQSNRRQYKIVVDGISYQHGGIEGLSKGFDLPAIED
jgi:hypothetical protein